MPLRNSGSDWSSSHASSRGVDAHDDEPYEGAHVTDAYADTPTEPVVEDKELPEEAERPLWRLNRDEQRVLLITFTGGFASIIVSACILGLAITIARNTELHQMRRNQMTANTLGTGAVFVVLAITVPRLIRRFHLDGGIMVFLWVLMFISAFIFSLWILTWVGLAGAIH